MSTRVVNDRFNLRINHNIKNKAEKNLQKHGLTLTDFVRNNITTVANFGLPDDYGLNDIEEEQYAAKHWRKFPKFHSVDDLMRFLNK